MNQIYIPLKEFCTSFSVQCSQGTCRSGSGYQCCLAICLNILCCHFYLIVVACVGQSSRWETGPKPQAPCFWIPKSSWQCLSLTPYGFNSEERAKKYVSIHEHFLPLAIPSRLPLLSCNDFFLRHVHATWWPKATDNLSFCLTSARVRCLFLNNASQNGEVVSDWLLLLTCPFLNQSLWLRNYGTLVSLIHGPTPVVWELRPGNGWLHLEKQG